MSPEATELPPAESGAEVAATSEDLPVQEIHIDQEENTENSADQADAAQALRAGLASHGIELTDAVQWSEVPGHLLTALLEALPPPPEPRPTADDQRRQLAERIARSQRLPRGVRERLASTLETVRFDKAGRDEPALRLSDAVALLEEALPAQLMLSPGDVYSAAHPRGDSFFTGDARSLTDDDARRIAAEQLARSGYKRA